MSGHDRAQRFLGTSISQPGLRLTSLRLTLTTAFASKGLGENNDLVEQPPQSVELLRRSGSLRRPSVMALLPPNTIEGDDVLRPIRIPAFIGKVSLRHGGDGPRKKGRMESYMRTLQDHSRLANSTRHSVSPASAAALVTWAQ